MWTSANLVLVMRTWHRNGFSPADASRFNIPICQPSERDYRYQVDLWKSDIASDEARMSQIQGERVANHPWSEATYNSLELMVRDSQQKISAAERFFTDDHHYLGNVFAASGNRLTTQERTLDWALVALKPERIGANMVSVVGTSKSKLETDSLVSSYPTILRSRGSISGQVAKNLCPR